MEKLKQIENYLDNTMSGTEKVNFEKSLSVDKELAYELEFHREINEAISDDEIVNYKKLLKSIIEKVHPVINNRAFISRLKIPLAASILILLGLGIINVLTQHNPSQMFSDFYKPYIIDISTRSMEMTVNNIQLPYYLYQEGDFQTSYEILKNYTAGNFNDQTAHFYLGLNSLELNYIDEAIYELSLVEQDRISPFALHARWYLVMAYLKTDNIIDAKKMLRRLVEEENMYSTEAKKILRQLKS